MASKLTSEQRGKILYGIADNLRNDIAIAHLAGEQGVEAGLQNILALVDRERAAIAAPADYMQADGMMRSQFVSREEW